MNKFMLKNEIFKVENSKTKIVILNEKENLILLRTFLSNLSNPFFTENFLNWRRILITLRFFRFIKNLDNWSICKKLHLFRKRRSFKIFKFIDKKKILNDIILVFFLSKFDKKRIFLVIKNMNLVNLKKSFLIPRKEKIKNRNLHNPLEKCKNPFISVKLNPKNYPTIQLFICFDIKKKTHNSIFKKRKFFVFLKIFGILGQNNNCLLGIGKKFIHFNHDTCLKKYPFITPKHYKIFLKKIFITSMNRNQMNYKTHLKKIRLSISFFKNYKKSFLRKSNFLIINTIVLEGHRCNNNFYINNLILKKASEIPTKVLINDELTFKFIKNTIILNIKKLFNSKNLNFKRWFIFSFQVLNLKKQVLFKKLDLIFTILIKKNNLFYFILNILSFSQKNLLYVLIISIQKIPNMLNSNTCFNILFKEIQTLFLYCENIWNLNRMKNYRLTTFNKIRFSLWTLNMINILSIIKFH
jgi:hypothetical protein